MQLMLKQLLLMQLKLVMVLSKYCEWGDDRLDGRGQLLHPSPSLPTPLALNDTAPLEWSF